MGDYDSLFTSLALGEAQKKAIAESDPYSGGLNFANSMGQTIATSGPDYSLKDKLIYGAIAGLLGGGLQNLSQSYQSRASDAYQQSVNNLMNGGKFEKPDVLSDTLFSSAKQQAGLFDLKQRAVDQQRSQNLTDETTKAVVGEIAKNPRNAAKVIDALGPLVDPKLKPIATSLAASDTVDSAYDKALDKLGTENLAEASVKRDLEAPDREEALRKDTYSKINTLPAVAQFQKVSTTLPTLKQYAGLDTKSSDFPFIYSFVQGLDGGVVKEGEVASIAGTNPLVEKYRNLFTSNLNGGSALGVELKQQMVKELEAVQAVSHAQANAQSKSVIQAATMAGLKNPYSAMPYDPDAVFGQATVPTTPTTPARADLIAEAKRRGLIP